MKNVIIYTILCLLGLNSCTQSSIRNYYFDFPTFRNDKVYKFIDNNNPDNIHYWHMYFKVQNSDTIFYTDGLDNQFRPVEVFVEKVKKEGTEMVDYYYISYDSLGNKSKIPCEILKNEVYAFHEFNNPLIWTVKYKGSHGQELLSKKRSLVGFNEIQHVLNSQHKCIKFLDEFEYEILEVKQNYTYSQESFYAENIGIVRYTRTLPNGTVLDYELKEIIDWNKIKN